METESGSLSTPVLLILIGALAFFSHASQMAFRRFKVPDTLWLIAVGMAVGPILGWLKPGDFGLAGSILTSVALAVILFEAGLDLRLKDLGHAFGSAVLLTLVVFSATALLLAAFVHYVGGFSWMTSSFVGVVAAAPSPPVVIPLLKGLSLPDSLRTTVTIESAISEALGLVVALAILRVQELREGANVGQMVETVLSSFVVASLLGLAFGASWAVCLEKIRGMKNAMILTPAFVFILFGFTEYLGFSGPVAVLVFGLVLGNASGFVGPDGVRMGDLAMSLTNVNAAESRFLGELVFILKTFFFVFLGMNMRLNDLWSLLAIGTVAILVLVRLGGVRVCLGRQVDAKTGTLLGVVMPKGLAAAVLAAAAQTSSGMPRGQEVDNLLYGVILYSILGTAVLVFATERLNLSRLFAGWLFPDENTPS
jgi:NhaP-type Na+/H+ or K+/H+ antiporter